ncbi:MAG TPA: SURF1 family protein [Macromonas sp.]|nr:SURF1 family protein [Macromonas sp.]
MLALVGIALFLLFTSLGVWQVQRLAWKEALIQRVAQRLHSAPMALPQPTEWPRLEAQAYEYQPVQAQGRWLRDKTVLTQAATELGSGFWVLTPLLLDDGTQVLVNRGFVPAGQREQWLQDMGAAATQAERVQVQGLLRVSEPGGGFLRHNDPAQQRWYSRDVAAIAEAQGLELVAPFFIDAGLPDARSANVPEPESAGPWPRPGMTVVRFSNSHLVYALTWFGLAAMVVVAALYVARHERRLRARQG